jgi:hypothetical protein
MNEHTNTPDYAEISAKIDDRWVSYGDWDANPAGVEAKVRHELDPIIADIQRSLIERMIADVSVQRGRWNGCNPGAYASHDGTFDDATWVLDEHDIADAIRTYLPTEDEDDDEDTPPAVAPVGEDVKTVRDTLLRAVKRYTGIYCTNDEGFGDELMSIARQATPPAVARNYGHIDYYGPLCGPITAASDIAPPAVADAGETGEKTMSRYSREDYSEREIEEMEREDAGETGEDDLFDFTITGTLEDDHKEMQSDNSFKGVLYRLAYMEARDDINREEVAALRRDVEGIDKLLGYFVHPLIGDFSDIRERIESLESRERPNAGTIKVTEKMLGAFFDKLTTDAKKGLHWTDAKFAIEAALAAREIEGRKTL